MAAAKLNLYLEQGSSFYRKLRFTDNATPTPAPINLTGMTFAGKIRKNISDVAEILSFTCTILNQSTNPGEMTITLTAIETAGIVLKKQTVQQRVTEPFCYDLELTYPSGTVERILEGVVNISPEVTR